MRTRLLNALRRLYQEKHIPHSMMPKIMVVAHRLYVSKSAEDKLNLSGR